MSLPDFNTMTLGDIAFRLATEDYETQSGIKGAPELLERAKQLLEQGSHPDTAWGTYNQSPLAVLAEHCHGNQPFSNRLAKILIDHGANPMVNNALLHMINQDQSKELIREVLLHLASKFEAGQYPRNAKGGNHLSHLVIGCPDFIENRLREEKQDQDEIVLFPRDMINEGRLTDGLTALHLVWSVIAGGEDQEDQQRRWWLTSNLLERGADPFLVDHLGQSVMDFIEKKIAEGHPLPEDPQSHVSEMIAVLREQHRLDTQTPPAQKVPARGVRL